MTYKEVLQAAQGQMGPCRACPVCNGRACGGTIPGPGAKGSGTVAIRNFDAWRNVRLNMDTIHENFEPDTSLTLFGRSFKYPFFAGPVGAMALHYGDKYNDLDSLKDAVVITQSGSVQEALYNQYINGACKEFKLVANMTDGYLAVAEGKADVCLCNTASAQLYADANGGMVITDYRFEVDPNMNGTCVAMPMDDTESLAEVVNQCIAELKENGQTDAWYSEYEEQAAALGIE